MRLLSTLAAATLLASPAMAEGPTLYAYPTNANYCPAGLQPVVLGGVICCGQPNTSMSYQQVMRHPVRQVSYQPKGMVCEEGEKGCK